jgi:hypothetical protein
MMGYNYNGIGMYDPFWDRASWKYVFALWPCRSSISNTRIWFKKAYKGTRIITGPGEPVVEHRWLTKEDYLLAAIKGKIVNDSW